MKTNLIVKRLRGLAKVIAIATLGWTAAMAQTKSQANTNPKEKTVETYNYNIIPSANNTWGYDILVNDKLRIHQPNIPGQTGNSGFRSKAEAKNIAVLVIDKIKKGEMPPTITKEELKKLNAN